MSDYFKMCNAKKKRNTAVWERLGLTNIGKNNTRSKKKIPPHKIRYMHDHDNILSYKEDNDKRYCKEENDIYIM